MLKKLCATSKALWQARVTKNLNNTLTAYAEDRIERWL